MSNLQRSVAIGDHNRNRPLIMGDVKIDGVESVPSVLRSKLPRLSEIDLGAINS